MINIKSYQQSIMGESLVFGSLAFADWKHLYAFATQQGIEAIVWDNIQQEAADGRIPQEQQLPRTNKLQWALAVDRIEQRYLRQQAAIEKLAIFFDKHNIKMMILKGYGLSLNYPIPNHRPCCDIDIWLFEEYKTPDGRILKRSVQQRADKLLHEYLNIVVDEDKHHHTVFYIDGVMVENHFDFLNIHAHRSNRIIETRLQQLIQQPMKKIEVGKAIVYLPSADFHALFMLRHSASHFAAERIVIRHLLDWKYFVEKHTSEIDWDDLARIAELTNMHLFLQCKNAICIEKLGLSSEYVPSIEREPQLEERVWQEILQPEFAELPPNNVGYLRSWSYMFRRWWANRWKHHIVYSEGLIQTFIVQIWSHIIKPKSLKL